MFRDYCFERSLLTKSRGELGTEEVEMSLGFRFFEALGFQQAPKLADLFSNSGDALRDGFEFEGELSALAAKGFDLKVGTCDFGLQTPGFAIGAGQALFSLCQLVAQPRGRRHGVKNGYARFFLLMFKFGERRRGGCGFLLRQRELVLSCSQIGCG